LGVLPYDPHDAASVPGTAEFGVQAVRVQTLGDGLERGTLGALNPDSGDDLLFAPERTYLSVTGRHAPSLEASQGSLDGARSAGIPRKLSARSVVVRMGMC
jgi:hypothetical protein